MTVLKFKNKEQADAIAGILDFSVGLIKPNEIKKFNKEMYEYAIYLTENLIYQQDNEVMYLKDKDVIFVADNAIWILTQEIKEKENEIYSNSIGLLKQLKQLLEDKIKKEQEKNFTIINGRRVHKKLEKFYKKNIDKEFLIKESFIFPQNINIPKNRLPVMPKKGEIWIIKDYLEGMGTVEEPIEDSLLLVNKLTNKQCNIFCSEFNKMSELND